jgi:EAL domain-containing protein (putative c-di-GMP-specific phosphodiesterase class I)/CheY-like chemotaxis protein
VTHLSHIFIVDDDALVRTLAANVLVHGDFVTHQFSTAPQVEAALTKWSPVLIILDLSLADSDAVEVMRSLATARFSGSVLLLSGQGASTLEEVNSVGEAHGLKMLPPLGKPFRTADLRAAAKVAAATAERRSSDTNLETALQNSWLELWYQPKIDLGTRTLCGAEGLIRIAHPEQGILLPGTFLPAPGDPLYVPLTDFIIRRALADWTIFSAAGMNHKLAINVPASVLQRPDFVSNLRNHLPKSPKFPGLIVEVTEDEAISNPDLAREIAVQLKLYKVGVSIDDFGAGHSTLARLKELPFSELKLDRSFVDGCSVDARKRQMCEAVAELALRFNITSVAEGIESQDDLKVITDLGYQIGQGFVFARPMPAAEFLKMLGTRTSMLRR